MSVNRSDANALSVQQNMSRADWIMKSNFTDSPLEPSPNADQCMIIFGSLTVFVICAFGIIGNVMSVAVLRALERKEQQGSTNFLLQVLALADSVFLTLCILQRSIFKAIDSYPESLSQDVLNAVDISVGIVLEMALTFAVWMVVLVTVDRYLAACKPMHTHWRTKSRMKLIVLILAAVSVIIFIPAPPVYLAYTPYFQIFLVLFYWCFCQFVGPLLILVTLNVLLIRSLRIIHRKRQQMATNIRRQRNVTLSVVIVVVVFVVCEFPNAVFGVNHVIIVVNHILDLDDFFDKNAHLCHQKISAMLMVMNSSLNFIIYCLAWKKFRHYLITEMRRRCLHV